MPSATATLPPPVKAASSVQLRPTPPQSLDARVAVLEARWEDTIPTLATKADLAALRSELKADLVKLEDRIEKNMTELRAEIREDMSKLEIRLTRLFLGTAVTIILSVVGSAVALFLGLKA